MINLIKVKNVNDGIKCTVEKIQQTDNTDLKVNNIILTEDKFTLSLEELITSGRGGTFNTDVLSFSRLTDLINTEKHKYLTKTGSIILMHVAIEEEKKKFSCFTKVNDLYSLAENTFNTISQIKSSYVKSSDLEVDINNKALSAKLNDLKLLYDNYDKKIRESYVDSFEKFEILKELVKDNELLKNSNVYITGFKSLTKQLIRIILNINAKNVYVFCPSFNNGSLKDTDFQESIISGAKVLDIEINETEYKCESNSFCEELEQCLFSYRKKAEKINTDKIRLFKAKDFKREVVLCAKNIRREIKTNDIRFKDIAVLCNKDGNAFDIFYDVFKEYGIPFFIDKKDCLINTPVAEWILNIFKAKKSGYLIKYMLEVLKSPYFECDSGHKDLFENYVIKYGINKGFFSKPFKYGDFKEVEPIRKKLIKLLNFDIEILEMDKVENYVKKILAFFDKSDIFNVTVNMAKSFENTDRELLLLSRQIERKMKASVSELVELIGEKYIALEDFIILLENCFKSMEISVVPMYNDCVVIGNFNDSRIYEKKVVIGLSMNDGYVPGLKKDVGLLSDRDLTELNNLNVVIEPMIESVNRKEKINVVNALCSFKERLYLSYSEMEANQELAPSSIIDDILNSFLNNGKELKITGEKEELRLIEKAEDSVFVSILKEEIFTEKEALRYLAKCISEKNAGNNKLQREIGTVRESLSNKDVLVDSLMENSDKEQNIDIFNNKTVFSVSNLEKYFSCPYSHFVQYGLRAKEREVAEVKAMDSGNFIHKAAELFLKMLEKDKNVSVEKACFEITEVLRNSSEYSFYNDIPKYKTRLDKLCFELKRIMDFLKYQKENSEFKTKGMELSFGKDNSDLPLLRLSDNVFICGQIDRVDSYNNFVAIIDYKTGKIASNEEEIYSGLKIQPYIYLEAIKEFYNLNPFAALYMPLSDDYQKDNSAPYKMKGYCLDDLKTLIALDCNLKDESFSDIIPIKLKKDGSISSLSKTLKEDELKGYIDYSAMIATKAGNEIREGVIEPSPYKGVCRFCKFNSICFVDKSKVIERDTGKVTKEIILEAVKNGKKFNG